ncbi:uncharacterized protein K452DRAFT_284522 [Aplosporella prunicola CBS 121167]|uniref:Zn(2)-C6 fungal-type domain-containing protein n=1 Tax=Aplosporella prunicola CBS 121167 TaxID=1176127 RepID=A0A6A6BLZ6_9PEZI|nr:uncharacterized protein K452DRAFT_284522 [Aplosporella prunicola CBS 121167]KAF2145132.1 hypothetical protein K452DRAFT_284522 [Aplosporella prunicola CBS 121167]
MLGNDGGNKAKRKCSAAVATPTDHQDNPAPPKRQRVSRACDQCRAAREKCDGVQPICYTCASSNRECSYTATSKKRGIQPGHIRAMELALAWVFDNVPGTEDALLSMLGHPEGRSLLCGKDTEGSLKLHKRWRKSNFCKEIDRSLTGADPAIDLKKQSPASIQDDQLNDGEFAAESHLAGKAAFNAALHSDESSILPGSHGNAAQGALKAHGPCPLRTLPSRIRSSSQLTPMLKIPSNLWRLLDVYFAYTHCWFPIVEKHDIMKLSYTYPEEGLDISADKPGSGEHAELWSILALASLQQQAANPASSWRQDDGAPVSPSDIYNIARGLIPTEQGTYELGHAKALLLLALINIGGNNLKAAWLLIGHAARLATLLGLHNQHNVPGGFAGTEEQNPRRKHVFLACFALDTLVSANLGEEPSLKTEHVKRLGLLDEDGLEEWQPWVGCPDFKPSSQNPAQYTRSPVHTISTFNHIIRIMSVINDASMRFLDSHHASMRLQQWVASLPQTLSSVQSNQPTAAPTPTLAGLRLIYCCTIMAVSVSPVVPAENVVESFIRFADAFGAPAMLPIFRPLIALAERSGSFKALSPESRYRWATLMSSYRELWQQAQSSESYNPNATDPMSVAHSPMGSVGSMAKPPSFSSSVAQYPSSSSTAFGQSTFGNNVAFAQRPFHTAAQYASANHHPSNPFPPHSLPFQPSIRTPGATTPNKESTLQQQTPAFTNGSMGSTPNSNLCAPTPRTIYDNAELHRFHSAGPVALDSLFDELNTLDGHNSQPQFMQNLDFGSDMNLNDVLVLTSDQEQAEQHGFGAYGIRQPEPPPETSRPPTTQTHFDVGLPSGGYLALL